MDWVNGVVGYSERKMEGMTLTDFEMVRVPLQALPTTCTRASGGAGAQGGWSNTHIEFLGDDRMMRVKELLTSHRGCKECSMVL